MTPPINAELLARGFLAAQRAWPHIAIQPYVAEPGGLAVINPFVLSLPLNNGSVWNAIILFEEYPARVFPRVVARSLPPCPHHPSATHPNFSARSGMLEVRPVLPQPEFDVQRVVWFLRLLLEEPMHQGQPCGAPLARRDAAAPASPPEPQSASQPAAEQKEARWLNVIRAVGEGAETVKTVIEVGKLAGLLACLVSIAANGIK